MGLPALAGRGKELTSEGSMPDGVTIIDKLDEPSMGESSFKGSLPPLGGSLVTTPSCHPPVVPAPIGAVNPSRPEWPQSDRQPRLW